MSFRKIKILLYLIPIVAIISIAYIGTHQHKGSQAVPFVSQAPTARDLVGMVDRGVDPGGPSAADNCYIPISSPPSPCRGRSLDPSNQVYAEGVHNIVVNAFWTNLVDSSNNLKNNNIIDQAIQAVSSYNASAPSTNKIEGIKIRFYSGNHSPSFALQKMDGCTPLSYSGGGLLPCYWTTTYGNYYNSIMNQLKSKYDLPGSLIKTITVSRCSLEFPEVMIHGTGEQSNLLAMGFSVSLDGYGSNGSGSTATTGGCQFEEVNEMKGWTYIKPSIAFNPYPTFSKNASGQIVRGEDLNFTETVMNYCRSTLGTNCVLENDSVRCTFLPTAIEAKDCINGTNTAGPAGGNMPAMYSFMQSKGQPLEFQTAITKNVENDWQGAVKGAIDLGADAVEIPNDYNNASSPTRYTAKQINIFANLMGDTENPTSPPTSTPSVAFNTPAPNATVNGTIFVKATGNDTGATITTDSLKVDGTDLNGSPCSGSVCNLTWDTTKVANGPHTLLATVTDSLNNTATATETVTVSNAVPVVITPPSNLSSPSQTTTSISLSWSPAVETGVSSFTYTITRTDSSSQSTVAGTTTSTTFTDSGLSPGATYAYTITASDSTGHTSAASKPFSQATKSVCPPPASPTGVSASATSPTSIAISWSAVSPNPSSCTINHYDVEQASSGTVIAQVASPTTSYTNTNLTPKTSYAYQIVAVTYDNQASNPSRSASATTPAATDTTPPSAPSNLTATATSDTEVDLSWTASADPDSGIASYTIMRGSQQVDRITPPASNPTTITWGETGLTGSTAYSYQVIAVNGVGLTTASTTVSVTTLPTPTNTGGNNNSGGSTPTGNNPLLSGTTSIGTGSDNGSQNTTDNPTSPSAPTTDQVITSTNTNHKAKSSTTTRDVILTGAGIAGVLLILGGFLVEVVFRKKLDKHNNPNGPTPPDPTLPRPSDVITPTGGV